MENDLLSVYEQHYLNPQKASVISEANEDEDTSTAPKATKNSSPRKKKLSGAEIGAIYGTESVQRNSFDSLFKTFMEEFDSGDQSFDDNSFEFDGEDTDDGFADENEQTFTLSELKAMTLGELADLVGGNAGNDDDMFSDDDGMDFDDEGDIPTESYGQGGAGKHYGDQGNYDGKAKKQAASSHVKGNGDANLGKSQRTGYGKKEGERLF